VLAALLIAAPPLVAQAAPPTALPAWWTAFLKLPAFQARFVQESESAVFGTLKRKGSFAAARGGRLRAAYDQGLLLMADGRELVQYDPDTRTAQRWDLRLARADAPMLALLLDPGSVGASYNLESLAAGRLRLKPRRKDLPEVEMEGQGSTPTQLRWTDPSGARQVLRLEEVRTAAALPPATFQFSPPKGTRWVGGR
jgi:outer membrane lipoprotein-sorting protein